MQLSLSKFFRVFFRDLHRCRFPGSSLIGLLGTFNMNQREVSIAFEKIDNQAGWMTRYNVDHKFSSPYRVHDLMRSISYLSGSLKSLESQLKRVLQHYFDPFTVEEWLEENVDPLVVRVDDMNDRAAVLTSSMTWPRRPIVADALLKDRRMDVDANDSATTTLPATAGESDDKTTTASTSNDAV